MTLAEQARTAVAISNEKAQFVRGALHQAGLDIDEIVAQLAQVSDSADAVQQAAAIYTQAKEQLEQLQGLISAATESAEQYAAQW